MNEPRQSPLNALLHDGSPCWLDDGLVQQRTAELQRESAALLRSIDARIDAWLATRPPLKRLQRWRAKVRLIGLRVRRAARLLALRRVRSVEDYIAACRHDSVRRLRDLDIRIAAFTRAQEGK